MCDVYVWLLAISGGGRGNVDESRCIWVCERRFWLYSHWPRRPEERDGAASAQQERQRPHTWWSALNLHSFSLSLSLALIQSCIKFQIIKRNLTSCFFFALTSRRSVRVGEGAATGAAGVWGGDRVGQQRRTVGPRDRENAAGWRELNFPMGRVTLRRHDRQREKRPPSRAPASDFFFVHNVPISEGEGLQQEWVTSAADCGFVLVR